MSGGSPFPGSQTAIFLAVSSRVGRGSGTLWVLSHEGTIVIYEGLHPADLIISQKVPHSNTIESGIGIST